MSRDFTREPPRGFEPRTYALRAVRQPLVATLLLVHTPAYPGILGDTGALFRGVSGASRRSRLSMGLTQFGKVPVRELRAGRG